MSSEMDFDDFINDIELMGCHAIDESFEFEENGVVPPDAKMPTLEDEPRTSWFNSDNNSSSSRKRENSSPLPDAKRQRTDDENSRELTDQDLEELFGSLGDALESCEDEIPAADCLTNSSTDDDNGRELTSRTWMISTDHWEMPSSQEALVKTSKYVGVQRIHDSQ